MVGEYLSATDAAQYLGYKPSTFRAHVRGGAVPRYGPRGNRFRKVDLDAWMENPQAFSKQRKVAGVRLPGDFTPVKV
ncbi:helix-turn-helix domain-containing protein [Desulfovibrio cuneatus]|uniref:helix-turn-helix domain-containing protein n=1 Tax=Desulfovibrio cuneatus TaxID=159728 RepID=UPI000414C9F0|nr:helix-turn-helix domain-containing protein [Desulfovibrio cuneatus]